MINNRTQNALHEILANLRKAETDLRPILNAAADERTLLPERLWRSSVDFEMEDAESDLAEALENIGYACVAIARVLGEDESPEAALACFAPLPKTDADIDAARRARARDLRARKATRFAS